MGSVLRIVLRIVLRTVWNVVKIAGPVAVACSVIALAPRRGRPQAPGPASAEERASADTGVAGRASHERAFWQGLSAKDKDAYVRTFLAGVRSAQVREIAVAEHRMADSAVVPGEVETAIGDSLRASHAVRFPFAATVYVAQLDDFYWWRDHAAVPVGDALNRINAQMEALQSGSRQ